MLRLITAVAAALLPFSALAQPYADPRALLEDFYKPYFAANYEYVDPAPMFSTGLNELYRLDREEANGEMGRLDFDPYIQGQDWDTKSVDVGEPDVLGGTARVPVTFTNFDRKNELVFSLVLEREGWKIDDAWWPPEGEGFGASVREFLTSPWPY